MVEYFNISLFNLKCYFQIGIEQREESNKLELIKNEGDSEGESSSLIEMEAKEGLPEVTEEVNFQIT